MFRFEDTYQYEPGKFLCDGWCCRYAPSPRDPREPEEVFTEEEQAQIEKFLTIVSEELMTEIKYL